MENLICRLAPIKGAVKTGKIDEKLQDRQGYPLFSIDAIVIALMQNGNSLLVI